MSCFAGHTVKAEVGEEAEQPSPKPSYSVHMSGAKEWGQAVAKPGTVILYCPLKYWALMLVKQKHKIPHLL